MAPDGADDYCLFFFFQAEDGIRDAQESRGLGDVYKRQESKWKHLNFAYLNPIRLPDLQPVFPRSKPP